MKVQKGDCIEIKYVGRLDDGMIFDFLMPHNPQSRTTTLAPPSSTAWRTGTFARIALVSPSITVTLSVARLVQ